MTSTDTWYVRPYVRPCVRTSAWYESISLLGTLFFSQKCNNQFYALFHVWFSYFTVIDKQKLYMITFVHNSQYELPIYFVVEYLNFDFNIIAGLPYYLQSEAFMEFIKICHQRDTKSQIWAKLPLFITLSIIIPI